MGRAAIVGEELLAELLANSVFTQDDLTVLLESKIPEERAGAALNLVDRDRLAKVAQEDNVRQVRDAAARKLNGPR